MKGLLDFRYFVAFMLLQSVFVLFMFKTQDTSALQAIQNDIHKLGVQIKKAGINPQGSPPQSHIKDSYPALMKHRYTLADSSAAEAQPFKTKKTLELVLVEENDMKFWAWNYEGMIDFIFNNPGETVLRRVFKNILEPMGSPNLFVDVGSNIGLYSLIAASYNTKRIYAFDAQYLCSKHLAESAKVNGFDNRIAAINMYVSKDEGSTTHFPANSCIGIFQVKSYTESNVTKKVHSVNLDHHFLDEDINIDLMKIDVEGAELMVLAGARELLKQHRVDNLVIEITPQWWKSFSIDYDTGAAMVKEILVDTGYKMWCWQENGLVVSRVEGWEELSSIIHKDQHNCLFTLKDYESI